MPSRGVILASGNCLRLMNLNYHIQSFQDDENLMEEEGNSLTLEQDEVAVNIELKDLVWKTSKLAL